MFFYLPQLEILATMIALILLSSWVHAFARPRKMWIRILSLLFTVLNSAVCLVLMLMLCFSLIMAGPDSRPKYSPDHKLAAVIRYTREGVGTAVQLYSWHGLRNDEVFTNSVRKSVQENDIQWIDDKHLLIHYQPSLRPDEAARCYNIRDVQVQCIAKPTP